MEQFPGMGISAPGLPIAIDLDQGFATRSSMRRTLAVLGDPGDGLR